MPRGGHLPPLRPGPGIFTGQGIRDAPLWRNVRWGVPRRRFPGRGCDQTSGSWYATGLGACDLVSMHHLLGYLEVCRATEHTKGPLVVRQHGEPRHSPRIHPVLAVLTYCPATNSPHPTGSGATSSTTPGRSPSPKTTSAST